MRTYKFADFVTGRITLEIRTPNDAALLIHRIGEFDMYKRCAHVIRPGTIIRYDPGSDYVSFNEMKSKGWYPRNCDLCGLPPGYLLEKRLHHVIDLMKDRSSRRCAND